jgi:hypothetical protein
MDNMLIFDERIILDVVFTDDSWFKKTGFRSNRDNESLRNSRVKLTDSQDFEESQGRPLLQPLVFVVD